MVVGMLGVGVAVGSTGVGETASVTVGRTARGRGSGRDRRGGEVADHRASAVDADHSSHDDDAEQQQPLAPVQFGLSRLGTDVHSRFGFFCFCHSEKPQIDFKSKPGFAQHRSEASGTCRSFHS